MRDCIHFYSSYFYSIISAREEQEGVCLISRYQPFVLCSAGHRFLLFKIDFDLQCLILHKQWQAPVDGNTCLALISDSHSPRRADSLVDAFLLSGLRVVLFYTVKMVILSETDAGEWTQVRVPLPHSNAAPLCVGNLAGRCDANVRAVVAHELAPVMDRSEAYKRMLEAGFESAAVLDNTAVPMEQVLQVCVCLSVVCREL